MSFHLLTKLSRDICQLFDTAAYYDVIIRVGKGTHAKEFQAHSLILRTRSSYFRANLVGDKAKTEYDKIIINKTNITPSVFEVILKYIYSGKVDFMNCRGQNTLDLLFAAEELGLIEILEYIQDHLIHNQEEWMDTNFIEYHREIFDHDSFKTLQIHYANKIAYNPMCVFENQQIFSPTTLNSLDERGCIKLNEAMWGFIVNWTRSQIPRLSNQVSGWIKEDWDEFKETLEECIPWKSIMNLSWSEFSDLLIPCEPFLPKERFEVALIHHLVKACGSTSIITPISTNHGSTILNICHSTLLSSWIDRKEHKIYRPAEIPYEFKLIVRGRRDGFSPETFHQKCETIPRTIVVFKMNKTNALYGGYNPLDWKFDRTTKDSFIFNFDDNKADINRLTRVAIHKRQGYGPCFGHEDLLAFPNGKQAILWKTNDNSESLPVVDYEVYQVVDKLRRPNFNSSTHEKNGITHKKR
ncbi:hypothetical protein Glove_99g112 [Diversispora epigaea]|uniref:BTB domain-containing protein n=1 Tax=Diversispora epigaea TaxID=1348612 RepID=A0A397J703_9GLOM|nr:hypothetical protein Glove_99g112 [Diversispora epigaea]